MYLGDTMRKTDNPMANLIRATFRRSGLSVKRLSQEAGVPYASAHGFMAGQRDPTLGTVARVCDVLDLELRPVPKSRRKG
jgi:hypothetical protein